MFKHLDSYHRNQHKSAAEKNGLPSIQLLSKFVSLKGGLT
ncbi:hypothetical protein NY10_1036 [Carnobacterium antarcticum]|nr:hypothetical protein NY10_1036 [Carnobacterium sp. CP1]